MMPDFTPADGVQAQWRYAYDLVKSKKPGDDITFLALAECLGEGWNPLDKEDQQRMRGIMDLARKHLEEDRLPSVRTVFKYGWRVTEPATLLDMSEERRQKALRANERVTRALNAIERSDLAPIDQQRYDAEVRTALGAARVFGRRRKSAVELERKNAPRELPSRDGRK